MNDMSNLFLKEIKEIKDRTEVDKKGLQKELER